jgi:hypothetical protein
MGFDPHTLPPQMRRYMPATEPQSMAAQERRAAATDAKLEREMHDEFATWLTQHAAFYPVPFVHSRMDKASTIREGWPDFTVLWMGKVCCIEFKLPGSHPTAKQWECLNEIRARGTFVIVATSTSEAMTFVKDKLLL